MDGASDNLVSFTICDLILYLNIPPSPIAQTNHFGRLIPLLPFQTLTFHPLYLSKLFR